MIEKSLPIWTDCAGINQYVDAMREFEIKELPKKAELEIFASGGYVVFVNSQLAATSRYRTFPERAAYGVYDISDYLKEGTNTLFITAYHQGSNTSTDCQRVAAVCFALSLPEGDIYSDENTLVRENPYYESGDIEKVSNQLGYTFHYNANGIQKEWQRATIAKDFSAEFKRCPVDDLVRLPLEEGRIKTQGHIIRNSVEGTPAEMMHNDFMSPRKAEEVFNDDTIKKNDCGVYFVKELPEEIAGFLYMDIDAPEGTVIDIGFGEHLDDLRVRTAVGRRNFAARYIAAGKDKFTSYFLRIAAKYIEVHITNMTDDVKIKSLGLIPTEYPIARIAEFSCDDFLFKRIYDVSLRTMRLCMHEHYEDGPWREQALYAYDSYVQMLCGYYAFGEYKFARASLELLASGILECGLLPITAPGAVSLTIPCFSLSWIMSLEKYVLYSGDIKFGIDMLKIAERILGAFKIEHGLLRLETGSFYWNFYEWTEGLDGYSRKDCTLDAVSNLMYIIAYGAYTRLCKMTSTTPVTHDIEGMKSTVYNTFYNKERGLYRTRPDEELYHELTQSLAVIAQIGEEDTVLEKLADSNNDMVKVSLSTSLFKYTALLDKGEKYADMVLCEIAGIWGDMIAKGAGTLWETVIGADDFDYAGSLCHAWSAVPVYLLFRYYIGYYPTSPGFCEYELKPLGRTVLKKLEADLFKPELE